MIFVAGGTGLVGSRLVRQVVQAQVDVRCLVHSTRPAETHEGNVELVVGDLDDPGTYASALNGCDGLFLLTPPHPDQVTREAALIEAARAAGVRRVVAISVLGSDRGSPVSFARWHGEIDDHLSRSGLLCSIVRPACFMQVHLNPPTAAAEGRWYGTAGDGAHAFVDADDVAAVAAELLVRPRPGSDVYEITGPAAITLPEAAATLGRSLGRDVTYVDLSADQLAGALLSNGVPGYLVDGIVGLHGAIRAGYAATVTDTVEQLLGRVPRTYGEVLRTAERDSTGATALA
jgi:uncharacterized protein YbjT (DUF2867 family)